MPVNVEPTAGAPAAAPVVEPLDETATAPPEVEATGEAGEAGLPPDLLQIPAFQGLMSGQPPAVAMPLKDFSNRPEAQIIAGNKDQLQQAGIGFYRALDGNTGVIFNSLYVKPADIQAADKAGRLAEIAPSFDDVNGAVLQAGQDNPVLKMGSVPGGPAGVAPAPPQMGSRIPPTSGLSGAAEKKITSARLKNLQAGPPSSGAKPGAGRLLNSLLKPVV
jgi:hypothetical protein